MSIDEVIENALFDYCVAWRDRTYRLLVERLGVGHIR